MEIIALIITSALAIMAFQKGLIHQLLKIILNWVFTYELMLAYNWNLNLWETKEYTLHNIQVFLLSAQWFPFVLMFSISYFVLYIFVYYGLNFFIDRRLRAMYEAQIKKIKGVLGSDWKHVEIFVRRFLLKYVRFLKSIGHKEIFEKTDELNYAEFRTSIVNDVIILTQTIIILKQLDMNIPSLFLLSAIILLLCLITIFIITPISRIYLPEFAEAAKQVNKE